MLVLQALYEDKYHPSIVEEELEELLEKLRKIEDPTYTKMSDQEVEDLVDQVINHENKRKSRKETKAPTQKTLLVKNTSEIVDLPSPPKSGGMSFTDLEKADEANESGKGGFED
jgi:predicted metal-dependent hydrolase